jgi:hypothetical protein
MKNSGLLIAFGLIGFGLYQWSKSGSGPRLGSNFKSTGTAKIPSIFGARAATSAPVFGGYSTAGGAGRGTQGGASSVDLGAVVEVAGAAADSARRLWRSIFGGSSDDGPLTGTRSGGSYGGITPPIHSPVPDFNTSSGTFDLPAYQGVDDIDTGDIGGIA